MTPSSNTRSISKTYKESLAIFSPTSPTPPSLLKSDLNKIHNGIKSITSMTNKHHSDMKTLN